jgi:hypothetical protein
MERTLAMRISNMLFGDAVIVGTFGFPVLPKH